MTTIATTAEDRLARKVVEHCDVLQTVPEQAANGNGIF